MEGDENFEETDLKKGDYVEVKLHLSMKGRELVIR